MAEKKNRVGRPLKFKSATKLQEKINEYFESCWEIKRDMFGNAIIDKEATESGDGQEVVYVLKQFKPYTVGGLAAFLNCSRQTLVDYSGRKEFLDIIKEAKDRIEAFAEEQLYTGKNQAGAIFVMKAKYGWQDKQVVEGNMIFKEMGPVKLDDGEDLHFDIGDQSKTRTSN